MDEMKKKFVSEDEIEEKRQKRQEEWERVRQPNQPLEAPEEPVDNRTLFEKLEEQKTRKQDEYDEAHKLRNMVKGLENDEVEFLDYVSKRQEEIDEERMLEEKILLHEYKNSVSKLPTEKEKSKPPQKKTLASSSGLKSQKKLLAGIVKRKSTETNETNSKRLRSNSEEAGVSEQSMLLAQGDSSSESVSQSASQNGLRDDMLVDNRPQTGQIIGILPGLGVYSDTDDDDTTSSSSGFDESPATIEGVKVRGVHCDR